MASTKPTVMFLTGIDTALDSVTKKAGQILFSIDSNNFGQIWFDKNNTSRVRMTGAADWNKLFNVPDPLVSGIKGTTNTTKYTIQLYDTNGQLIVANTTTPSINGLIEIPAATTAIAGLVTTGAQTLGGNKTFADNVIISGTLSVADVASFNKNTDATSVSAAGAVFAGGVGIAKKLFIGDDIIFAAHGHHISTDVSGNLFTLISDNTADMWVGAKDGTNNAHVGSLTLHAGVADTTNYYVNRSVYVWVGNSDTDIAGAAQKIAYGTAGSQSQPIYVDSNGKLTATTYALNATIDTGTANRMAYYKAAGEIDDAASIYASTNSLTINGTSAPANSGKFQVVGTATMRDILPESNQTYTLGTENLGWKYLYLNSTGAGAGLTLRDDGQQYGRFYIDTFGTESALGRTWLLIGNSISSGSAKNSQGTIRVYYTSSTYGDYNAFGWTGAPGGGGYTFLGSRSSVKDTAAYTIITVGNSANVNTTDMHSEGQLRLYSAATKYHQLQGASTTTNYEHTMPNHTGWLASGAAAGVVTDGKTLMYLANTGILTASAATVGANEKPVYLNKGVLTEISYYTQADINAGTTYGLAYYSSANSISGMAPGSNQYMILQQGSTIPEWTGVIRPVTHNNSNYTLGTSAALWHSIYGSTYYVGDAASTNINGKIRIFGNKKYVDVMYSGVATTNITAYIPPYNNTIYFAHTGSTDAVGSVTKPVYVDTNGRITVGSYELKAQVEDGLTDRLAYYSNEYKVEDAPQIFIDVSTSGTPYCGMAINKETAPISGSRFQVVGTSTMQTILTQTDNTYDLGAAAARWANIYGYNLYLGKAGASGTTGKIILYNAANEYAVTITTASQAGARNFTIPTYVGDMFAVHYDGTNQVGSNADASKIPVYVTSDGRVTPMSGQIGDINKPIYMTTSGALEACSDTVGSGVKPIYMNGGTLTASGSTVASGTQLMYLNSGTLTVSTSTVGSVVKPVYMSNGTLTSMNPTQYKTWSWSASSASCVLSSSYYTADTVVLALVVTSGEANITSAITWTPAAGSLTLSMTSAPGAAVDGYVITANATVI